MKQAMLDVTFTLEASARLVKTLRLTILRKTVKLRFLKIFVETKNARKDIEHLVNKVIANAK